jgi:pimeloyl-ACP methyl ester carboxylesterase
MYTTQSTIVFVHGAWHGSWCWQRVIPLLEKRGVATLAVDLPSVGAEPGSGIDLSADAARVESVLEGVSGPVLLCGHSYGGMVISRVAAQNVTRLVYVCAFMPLEGQSLVDAGGGKPAPWIQVLDGGLMQPDPTRSAELFYGDCDPQLQEWACARIRPQSSATMMEPVAHPSWRNIPSTYVVCTLDAIMPLDVQRNVFGRNASEVVELHASHSPFLSQPQALADLLAVRSGAASP